MSSSNQISPARLWTGRIISALAVLFLLFDGVAKLFKPAFVVEATVKLGYPYLRDNRLREIVPWRG